MCFLFIYYYFPFQSSFFSIILFNSIACAQRKRQNELKYYFFYSPSTIHPFDCLVIRQTNLFANLIFYAMGAIVCVCVFVDYVIEIPNRSISSFSGSVPVGIFITFYGFYFYTCNTRCHLFQRRAYCVSCVFFSSYVVVVVVIVVVVAVASSAFRFRPIRLCQKAMRVECVHVDGANFSSPHM